MINIAAFVLPLILFFFWTSIGYAVLTAFRAQYNHVRNMLLAPCVGLAVNTLALFIPSWYGLPVINYALGLLVLLLVVCWGWLLYRRPIVPFQRYWPFLILILFALFLTGNPLLKYGFNWLSYANNDMANYCLSAQWILYHGCLAKPSIAAALGGVDNGSYFWLRFVFGERLGSELLLAWLSAISKIPVPQLFMSLLLGLQLTLLSAAAALVYTSKQWRYLAYASFMLLSCAALINLAVFYQLIAQVGGLSLFIALVAILPKLANVTCKRQLPSLIVLIVLLLAALLVFYHELFNFLVVSYLLYIVLKISKRQSPTLLFWIACFGIIIAICLLLNKYLANILPYQWVLIKMAATSASKDNAIFPYFLGTQGFAYLWGLSAIPLSTNLFFSLMGMVLFVGCGIAALVLSYRLYYPAVVMLVMYGMSLFLLRHADGFGLFKLAMYVQPFMLTVFLVAVSCLIKRRFYWMILVVVIALLELRAQHFYYKRSLGSVGGFVEIPGASQSKLLEEIHQKISAIPNNNVLLIAPENLVEQELLMYYAFNKPTFSISLTPFFEFFKLTFKAKAHNPLTPILWPDKYQHALQFDKAVLKNYATLRFNIPDTLKGQDQVVFLKQQQIAMEKAFYVFNLPALAVLNRHSFVGQTENLAVIPAEKAKNYLVFTNANLRQNYYTGSPSSIALFPLQEDYFYPHATWAAIGQYLLLQVVNPSGALRLMMNLSSTTNAPGFKRLPTVAVFGAQSKTLLLPGYGSARVISPVIHPKMIDGAAYLLIRTRNENQQLSPDNRYALVRDISVISDKDYQHMHRPSQISQFPGDLANPNLEYSGIYEDGWISNESYVKLTAPQAKPVLLLQGFIPDFVGKDYQATLTVRVGDKIVATTVLHPGHFSLKLTQGFTQVGAQRISLSFSNSFTLPYADKRVCGAKLVMIGFASK